MDYHYERRYYIDKDGNEHYIVVKVIDKCPNKDYENEILKKQESDYD